VVTSVDSDNDNGVYFILETSNSRIDKHRTVVEKHIKTTKYNAKKTRSQAFARTADRTASQRLWGSRDVIGHVTI